MDPKRRERLIGVLPDVSTSADPMLSMKRSSLRTSGKDVPGSGAKVLVSQLKTRAIQGSGATSSTISGVGDAMAAGKGDDEVTAEFLRDTLPDGGVIPKSVMQAKSMKESATKVSRKEVRKELKRARKKVGDSGGGGGGEEEDKASEEEEKLVARYLRALRSREASALADRGEREERYRAVKDVAKWNSLHQLHTYLSSLSSPSYDPTMPLMDEAARKSFQGTIGWLERQERRKERRRRAAGKEERKRRWRELMQARLVAEKAAKIESGSAKEEWETSSVSSESSGAEEDAKALGSMSHMSPEERDARRRREAADAVLREGPFALIRGAMGEIGAKGPGILDGGGAHVPGAEAAEHAGPVDTFINEVFQRAHAAASRTGAGGGVDTDAPPEAVLQNMVGRRDRYMAPLFETMYRQNPGTEVTGARFVATMRQVAAELTKRGIARRRTERAQRVRALATVMRSLRKAADAANAYLKHQGLIAPFQSTSSPSPSPTASPTHPSTAPTSSTSTTTTALTRRATTATAMSSSSSSSSLLPMASGLLPAVRGVPPDATAREVALADARIRRLTDRGPASGQRGSEHRMRMETLRGTTIGPGARDRFGMVVASTMGATAGMTEEELEEAAALAQTMGAALPTSVAKRKLAAMRRTEILSRGADDPEASALRKSVAWWEDDKALATGQTTFRRKLSDAKRAEKERQERRREEKKRERRAQLLGSMAAAPGRGLGGDVPFGGPTIVVDLRKHGIPLSLRLTPGELYTIFQPFLPGPGSELGILCSGAARENGKDGKMTLAAHLVEACKAVGRMGGGGVRRDSFAIASAAVAKKRNGRLPPEADDLPEVWEEGLRLVPPELGGAGPLGLPRRLLTALEELGGVGPDGETEFDLACHVGIPGEDLAHGGGGLQSVEEGEKAAGSRSMLLRFVSAAAAARAAARERRARATLGSAARGRAADDAIAAQGVQPGASASARAEALLPRGPDGKPLPMPRWLRMRTLVRDAEAPVPATGAPVGLSIDDVILHDTAQLPAEQRRSMRQAEQAFVQFRAASVARWAEKVADAVSHAADEEDEDMEGKAPGTKGRTGGVLHWRELLVNLNLLADPFSLPHKHLRFAFALYGSSGVLEPRPIPHLRIFSPSERPPKVRTGFAARREMEARLSILPQLPPDDTPERRLRLAIIAGASTHAAAATLEDVALGSTHGGGALTSTTVTTERSGGIIGTMARARAMRDQARKEVDNDHDPSFAELSIERKLAAHKSKQQDPKSLTEALSATRSTTLDRSTHALALANEARRRMMEAGKQRGAALQVFRKAAMARRRLRRSRNSAWTVSLAHLERAIPQHWPGQKPRTEKTITYPEPPVTSPTRSIASFTGSLVGSADKRLELEDLILALQSRGRLPRPRSELLNFIVEEARSRDEIADHQRDLEIEAEERAARVLRAAASKGRDKWVVDAELGLFRPRPTLPPLVDGADRLRPFGPEINLDWSEVEGYASEEAWAEAKRIRELRDAQATRTGDTRTRAEEKEEEAGEEDGGEGGEGRGKSKLGVTAGAGFVSSGKGDKARGTTSLQLFEALDESVDRGTAWASRARKDIASVMGGNFDRERAARRFIPATAANVPALAASKFDLEETHAAGDADALLEDIERGIELLCTACDIPRGTALDLVLAKPPQVENGGALTSRTAGEEGGGDELPPAALVDPYGDMAGMAARAIAHDPQLLARSKLALAMTREGRLLFRGRRRRYMNLVAACLAQVLPDDREVLSSVSLVQAGRGKKRGGLEPRPLVTLQGMDSLLLAPPLFNLLQPHPNFEAHPDKPACDFERLYAPIVLNQMLHARTSFRRAVSLLKVIRRWTTISALDNFLRWRSFVARRRHTRFRLTRLEHVVRRIGLRDGVSKWMRYCTLNASAERLQAHWKSSRTIRMVRHLKPRLIAAIKIQATWRMYHYGKLVLWRIQKERHDAAAKFQALFRGLLARKHMRQIVQRQARLRRAALVKRRKQMVTLRRAEAAMVIQRMARRHFGRVRGRQSRQQLWAARNAEKEMERYELAMERKKEMERQARQRRLEEEVARVREQEEAERARVEAARAQRIHRMQREREYADRKRAKESKAIEDRILDRIHDAEERWAREITRRVEERRAQLIKLIQDMGELGEESIKEAVAFLDARAHERPTVTAGEFGWRNFGPAPGARSKKDKDNEFTEEEIAEQADLMVRIKKRQALDLKELRQVHRTGKYNRRTSSLETDAMVTSITTVVQQELAKVAEQGHAEQDDDLRALVEYRSSQLREVEKKYRRLMRPVQDLAARIIQGAGRYYVARSHLLHALRSTYEKRWSEARKRFMYVNTRTGAMRDDKPLIFGDYDIKPSEMTLEEEAAKRMEHDDVIAREAEAEDHAITAGKGALEAAMEGVGEVGGSIAIKTPSEYASVRKVASEARARVRRRFRRASVAALASSAFGITPDMLHGAGGGEGGSAGGGEEWGGGGGEGGGGEGGGGEGGGGEEWGGGETDYATLYPYGWEDAGWYDADGNVHGWDEPAPGGSGEGGEDAIDYAALYPYGWEDAGWYDADGKLHAWDEAPE